MPLLLYMGRQKIEDYFEEDFEQKLVISNLILILFFRGGFVLGLPQVVILALHLPPIHINFVCIQSRNAFSSIICQDRDFMHFLPYLSLASSCTRELSSSIKRRYFFQNEHFQESSSHHFENYSSSSCTQPTLVQ